VYRIKIDLGYVLILVDDVTVFQLYAESLAAVIFA
jgi:hypothetical protein